MAVYSIHTQYTYRPSQIVFPLIYLFTFNNRTHSKLDNNKHNQTITNGRFVLYGPHTIYISSKFIKQTYLSRPVPSEYPVEHIIKSSSHITVLRYIKSFYNQGFMHESHLIHNYYVFCVTFREPMHLNCVLCIKHVRTKHST